MAMEAIGKSRQASVKRLDSYVRPTHIQLDAPPLSRLVRQGREFDLCSQAHSYPPPLLARCIGPTTAILEGDVLNDRGTRTL